MKRHVKTQESMVYTQEKKQPVEIVPEEAQMLGFLGKDFKSAIISMFTEHKTSPRKCVLISFISEESTTLIRQALAF